MQKESIFEVVRSAEDNYLNGTTKVSQYVNWSMHDTIDRIDAYLNSKHISGSQDSLGREKPFFNICTAASNIWYRATDIDRKDIRVLPSNSSQTTLAFVATVILHNWMKSAKFGIFLNEWGRTLARYGSAVCKFVEKDGELTAQVVPWNRLIADPINFNAIPTIEKLYLTPQELTKNKLYDKDQVEALINAQTTRKTLDGDQQDNQSKFIEVYEIHGEMPLAFLDEDPEFSDDNKWDEYRQQMHTISYTKGEGEKFNDFCLYKGKEKKHTYMITHLIPEDGRTLSIGAVEHLFEAQWMVNHSEKNIKDTLDLASKLIFQTSDANYIGRNVLSAIETGDILIHKENMPLTNLNNSKADIQAFQAFKVDWQTQAGEITSTPDSIKGNTLPSGTPYSLGAYLGAQANSLFELMTENKGLDLETMMREYIIPHIKTKMDTKDEIVAILDDEQIAEIDAIYVPRESASRYNKEFKEDLLKGNVPSPYQADVMEGKVRQDLSSLGNKRFFKVSEIEEKTWKKALEDFEMTVAIEVTNESVDKQAVLTTLSSLLQTIAANPAILQDPNAKMLFSRIVSESGVISPLSLSSAVNSPVPAPPGNAGALETITTSNGTETNNA